MIIWSSIVVLAYLSHMSTLCIRGATPLMLWTLSLMGVKGRILQWIITKTAGIFKLGHLWNVVFIFCIFPNIIVLNVKYQYSFVIAEQMVWSWYILLLFRLNTHAWITEPHVWRVSTFGRLLCGVLLSLLFLLIPYSTVHNGGQLLLLLLLLWLALYWQIVVVWQYFYSPFRCSSDVRDIINKISFFLYES